VPPAATGHIRSGVVAADLRAHVLPLKAPLRGAVDVRVYPADLALRLTALKGHVIVVRGYLGEPFLRLDGAGETVNEAAPTAAAVGLVKTPHQGTAAAWRHRSDKPSAVWHDGRPNGLASGTSRGRWTVPLVVDGQPATLVGEVWQVDPPVTWLWAALAAPFIVLTIVLLWLRRIALDRTAAIWLGLLAAGSAMVTALGFAFSSSAPGGRWVEGANELVFVLVGLALVLFGSPDVRALAGGGLGLLACFVGLTKLPVLSHGIIFSALPDTATRLAVVLSICAGAAAAVIGVAVFVALLESGNDGPIVERF